MVTFLLAPMFVSLVECGQKVQHVSMLRVTVDVGRIFSRGELSKPTALARPRFEKLCQTLTNE